MCTRRALLLVTALATALVARNSTEVVEAPRSKLQKMSVAAANRLASELLIDAQLDQAVRHAADARAKSGNADSRSDLDRALGFMRLAQSALAEGSVEEAVSSERLAKTPLDAAVANAGRRNESAAFLSAVQMALAALDASLAAALKTPIGYDVYMPSIAGEGERLEGLVVATLPEGRVDPGALEGTDVAVYNGSVADIAGVGEGGRISSPKLADFLPVATVPLLFVLADAFQGSPAPAIPETCAIAPPPSAGTAPSIAHASDVVGRDGLIRVTGTNLANISNPKLEYPNGATVDLPDTDVGSSMQRLILADRVLPKGAAKFTCTGPNGEKLEAPNMTTNPTVSLQGPSVVQRGSTGTIKVGADANCFVTLHGGAPQIALNNETVYVDKARPSDVTFTAKTTGAYTVTAAVDSQPPRNPDGEYITTKEPVVTCIPTATGTTDVTARTTVTRVGDQKPVGGAITNLVVTHPDGMAYTTVASLPDGSCLGTFSLPGALAPNLINTYVLDCAMPANNWMPVAMSFPAFFFGSGSGGSSKKGGETVAGWDPHKWIDDFNAATKDVAEFEVTVYCDQPGKGGDKDAYEDGDVGHTFVQISGGGHSITGGFYPASGYGTIDVLTDASKDGKLVDDKDHPWDVKKTYKVKFADVEKMKKKWKEWKTKKYNLRAANCTDFVKDVCGAGGVNLPGGTSSWPSPMDGTSSANPGAMGEDLVGQGGTRNK